MDKKKKVLIMLLVFVLLLEALPYYISSSEKRQIQTSWLPKRMSLLRNRMIKTKQRMKRRWRLI